MRPATAQSLPPLRPRRFAAVCRWLTLALLLVFAGTAVAERRDYYFRQISSAQGLAQNTVHALLQDDHGFIWVATQGGLHRYDGYGFTLLQHDPNDPRTLPESFVTALALAPDRRLWIGTNTSFLAALDLRTGAIERHRPPLGATDDPRRDMVAALHVDTTGALWIGTAAGIEYYDPVTGLRSEVLHLATAPRADRRGVPRSIDLETDRQARLWAATDGGLYRFEPGSRAAERVGPERPAFGIHRDHDGQLWAGTVDGLHRIDDDGSLHEVVDPTTGLAFGAVWRLTSDADNRLWMALLGGGLVRFDPEQGTVQRIQYRPELQASLPERAIAALLIDAGGLLWLGGEASGLATTDAGGAHFPLLYDLDPERDRAASNNIRALLEDSQGRLWLGADGDGLKRVDPQSGTFDNYIDALLVALGRESAGRGIRVLGLADGDAGRLWVSTDHGVFDLDPDGRHAQLVSMSAVEQRLVTDNQFRSVTRARDGTLWIGTFASGLAHYSPNNDRWRVHAHDPTNPETLPHNLINSVFEGDDGRLWVGTLDGLGILDRATGRVQRVRHDPRDPESLAGNLVRAVIQGADGRYWIATHSGLNLLLDEAADGRMRFRRYSDKDGLPSNTVYGVLEDRQGQLWVSTNLGLARMDPASNRIRRFGLGDGLQDLEFNGGAQLLLKDGRLAFGGIRGVNLFDPARIGDSRYDPPVVLTGLRVGSSLENLAGLAPPEQIEFAHAARVLRLRFAALDYTAPEHNRFEYLLQGFDRGWNDAGTTPDATYTNLDPGNYLLRVRATNHDGHWSARELSVPLTVVPPWWNSTPARAGYVLAAALAILLLLYAQRRRHEQERRLLVQIAEREERLKLALWGSGDEFWDWDVQANSIYRIGADQLLGMETEQQLSTDEWRTRAVHPEDLPRVQQVLQAHITGQTPQFESEHRVRNAEGHWVWVRSRGKVVSRDAAGNPLRIAGTARDITVSRNAERERRIASEVLRSMTEAVGVVDLDFRFVNVNPAFSRITGYSEEEVIGEPSSMLDSSQQTPDFYRRLRETVERVGHWKGEIWQCRKDGDEFLGWVELSEVRDQHGERSHYVAVVSDITDKKRAEQELRYLANYDTLTGLPNRALLSERLARAVVRARRQESKVGVLFMDLDRFKDINDSMGHAAGDRILKAAAARLLATVRETDTFARLGGDEFTVVLEDLKDGIAAEQMAARIVDAFAEPLELDGRSEAVISPSLGIALYPDHGLVPTDLLKFADTAMYQAKERGRNTWQMYTEAMDAETRRRASMLAALRRALDRGEFRLVYQPRLSLVDGRITGAEALLRWHSAEIGEVSPATFIPLAEETGLILAIGDWVLREAAFTLARWRNHGFTDLVMAVNVSVLQFLRSNLPEHVASVVEETGVPATALELEVTESMVMANAEQAIRVMRELKQLGLTLAIDDFGTGYSSLVYLKRLPIDTLKIDKEFVGDLTTDPDDEAITATVITMAHSLGLNVVAEGVESDEQLLYLREQRCDEIQGFWLSRPLDAHHCLAFIRDFRFDQRLPAAKHEAGTA